jgi:long-chain acyl-CoA synthetase
MTAIEDNLGYWCRSAVQRFPDKAAIVDLCGEAPREITYRALEEALDRVAAACLAAGLTPGDRLALLCDNRTEFVEIMFGAMRAGIVPVPLNTKLGADTLAYIVADAGCRAAAVEPGANAAGVRVMEEAGIGVLWSVGAETPGWQDYEAVKAAAPASFTPPELPANHPSFQPYTSGSTGRPKGVVLSHEGQMWWIRAVQRYWPNAPDSRALAAVPLYHKNAMAGAVKPMLHCGGSVVLLPDFEPRRFLKVLSEYRCTKAGAVPTVYTKLLQQTDLIDSLDFSSLRILTVGSATVQEELVRQIGKAFGCPVAETYGLTEGGPVMIGSPVDGRPVPLGSCGVAWPEGEVKLVRADGEEDPSDGELWVKNPGVLLEYHNLPEVTAKRVKDGWLATGDLFHRDADGFFYFRGRTDDMFKSSGESIYPKEVENNLLAHPKVYDACVVPVPDPEKGHVPVAMVMLKAGESVSEDELKAWTLEHGPAYSHPRRIEFVDTMPLNGAGKVDRLVVGRRLTERFGAEIAARRSAASAGA